MCNLDSRFSIIVGLEAFSNMKEYLEVLTESDLLEFRKDEAKYYTTTQGRRFLKMYNEVRRMIAPKEAKRVIAQ